MFFLSEEKPIQFTCTHLVQKPLPMKYYMLFMLLLRLCFSLHFSAWGESLFMSVQTCLMVVMYFYYTSRPLPGVVFPFLYGGICYVLTSGLTPMSFLVQFVSLNVVFLVISRVSIAPWAIMFFNLTLLFSLFDILIKDLKWSEILIPLVYKCFSLLLFWRVFGQKIGHIPCFERQTQASHLLFVFGVHDCTIDLF